MEVYLWIWMDSIPDIMVHNFFVIMECYPICLSINDKLLSHNHHPNYIYGWLLGGLDPRLFYREKELHRVWNGCHDLFVR